jgi:hypothetical protein
VGEGESPLHEIDVDKLAQILSTKAAPPSEEDLAGEDEQGRGNDARPLP